MVSVDLVSETIGDIESLSLTSSLELLQHYCTWIRPYEYTGIYTGMACPYVQ